MRGGSGSAAANSAGTSTAISYRLNTPSSRSAAAITACPSGRQAGVTTRARAFQAIERTARVATSTITISDGRPITCRSTAMVRPSGDHRGALNCVSGSEIERGHRQARTARRPRGLCAVGARADLEIPLVRSCAGRFGPPLIPATRARDPDGRARSAHRRASFHQARDRGRAAAPPWSVSLTSPVARSSA